MSIIPPRNTRTLSCRLQRYAHQAARLAEALGARGHAVVNDHAQGPGQPGAEACCLRAVRGGQPRSATRKSVNTVNQVKGMTPSGSRPSKLALTSSLYSSEVQQRQLSTAAQRIFDIPRDLARNLSQLDRHEFGANRSGASSVGRSGVAHGMYGQ
jgi:hypothetical protein